ncbi:MAG: hypothetical protein AAGU74_13770 [Bacillota bacterium]
MADYKLMYQLLFNAVTDAIQLLSEAQQQTEDIYIEEEDGPAVAALKALKSSKQQAGDIYIEEEDGPAVAALKALAEGSKSKK